MEGRTPKDVALEVFVTESLQRIYDSTGKSKELKQLRDQCKELIDELRGEEFGKQGSKVAVPFTPDISQQLLSVFKSAFGTANPRLIEPALSCLHKLVAYAYLQGETSNSGRLDDVGNIVTQAVLMASKCGEHTSPAIQLGVVKALLTFVTAEHFLVHGDSLMQSVRTVFNLAIGSGSPDMQSTAQSALLQMLNTVLKRVGQQVGSPHYTPQPSPQQTIFGWQRSDSGEGEGHAVSAAAAAAGSAVGALGQGEPGHLHCSSSAEAFKGLQESFDAAAAAVAAEVAAEGSAGGLAGAAGSASGWPLAAGSVAGGGAAAAGDGSGAEAAAGEAAAAGRASSEALSVALATELASPVQALDGEAAAAAAMAAAAEAAALGDGSPLANGAAVLAQQAQQAAAGEEEAGVEAMPLLPPGLPRIDTRPRSGGGEGRGGGSGGEGGAVDDDARAAQLASLAEQADLRGLERAFDALPQQAQQAQHPSAAHHPSSSSLHAGAPAATSASVQGASRRSLDGLTRQETPPDPRRALMRDRRAAAWRLLTTVEKDAVIVLSAMCKMAARETGFGAMESYMHKGKLLSLDLLLRVLSNPMHDWSHVRPVFAAELRQPLCVALLRNCMSPYDQALTAAVKIFGTVLSVPRLRAGMKAELGALYPLLLLRPLEADRPDNAHQVHMALEGLLGVCSSAQVLVDVFVNYDCSLQASNLFERTIKAVARLAQLPDTATPFQPHVTAKMRQTALKAMLAAVKSLDTWAGPIKSAAAAAAEGGGDAEAGDGNGPVAPGAASPTSPHRQMLERIAAAKEMKDSLQAAVDVFNRNSVKGVRLLVESGLADGSAEGVAAFLREHAARLDKGALGELMGDHEDFSIQVMHAYIDQERYMGMTIDVALRKLLAGFRLPGEAQKIDRIMEKFAERYCRDNPAAFAAADGAYLLAFAIIMLNTDAHNPMADRRILEEDFVTMCMYQDEESGEFRPILPPEDLQGIYARITENEIQVHDSQLAGPAGAAGAASGGGGERSSSRSRARLAAAMGLPQMVLPFWSGATWDKQHGVDVERQRLLAIKQEMAANGGAGTTGNMWHMASHAEHARPMLQVGGDSVLKCLSSCLASAPTLAAATPILEAYGQAIQLAALLRLEPLCESLIEGLAAAAGLESPGAYGSSQEAKQVASLSKLVSLGSCGEAGMIGGGGWVLLLRCLSALERLQVALMPGVHTPGAAPFGSGGAGSSADVTALPPPPQATSSFGRLLQRMGLGGGGEAEGAGTKLIAGLPIREGPGAGFVLWAETVGAAPIDRLYANSAGLPGDAVLTFMRALCAVSQEELVPGRPGERPRVHLLQRVVECAYHNMGRIRLVWSRLWNVVAQHLVSAACHTDPYVAMYAVDALRQLVAKLLDRAELARFTYQGDALRPFASILRHSDSPAVRELAVACVVHAVAAHPRGLGSGWRSVLEALTVAAGDPSPGVVNQALDALQPVVEALVHPEGVGHSGLRECVGAALAAVNNPHGFDELSTGALYLFQTIARRLADAVSEGLAGDDLLPLPSPTLLRATSEQGGPASTASSYPSPTPLPRTLPAAAEEDAAAAAAGGSGGVDIGDKDKGASSLVASLVTSSPSLASWNGEEREEGEGGPASAAAAGAAGAAGAAQRGEALLWVWQLVLVPLAAAARLDARPKLADTAAAVLMQILSTHGHTLSAPLWQALYTSAVAPVLALPPADAAGAAAPTAFAAAASAAAAAAVPAAREPSAAAEAAAAGGGGGSRRASGAPGGLSASISRTSTFGGGAAALVAVPPLGALSPEGLFRLERHASAHMRDLWGLVVDNYIVAGGILLPQALALLQQYLGSPSEQLAVLGVNQLAQLALKAAPVMDSRGCAAVVATLEAACALDPLQQDGPGLSAAAAADAVRRRCRLLVLLQRVLDLLLSHSAGSMPGSVQLALLSVLAGTVRRAQEFNGSCSRGIGSGSGGGAGGVVQGGVRRGLGSGESARLQAAAVLAAAGAEGGEYHGGRAGGGGGGRAGGGSRRSSSLEEGGGVGEEEEPSWEVVEEESSSELAGPEGGAEAKAEAGTRAGGQGSPPAGAIPALGTAPASGPLAAEGLLPALVRQEVQGGCLLIATLQRCSDQPLTRDGTEAIVQSEAEGRLVAYCLEVVAAAAARVGVLAALAEGSVAGGAGGEGAGGGGTRAAMAAAAGEALQPWEDALRAPLLETALLALAGLGQQAWRGAQPGLFGHLSRLLCSPSMPVRKALAQLMRRQLPAAFPALLE